MSLSYRVEHTDGSLEAFSRDRLLLSVLDALEHRKNYIEDAGILATTIITKLQNNKRLVIRQSDIIETCYSTLRRFNQGAAQIYMSRRVSR